MKKSRAVPATLIIALSSAMITSGCSKRECRDAAGNLRPDDDCRYRRGGAHWITRSSGFGSSSSSSFGS